jgi:hypothetical protein
MKLKIIGFCGSATAGKTTAANALVEALGYHKLSFAAPLRAMLRALGVTDEQMSAGKNAPIPWLGGKTPRELMQTIGTEWGRKMVSECIWLDATSRIILGLPSDVPGVVFDDVRFDNEAKMLRDLGGVIIRIERPSITVRMTHESEAGISGHLLDYVLVNDAQSEEGFKSQATCLCQYPTFGVH